MPDSRFFHRFLQEMYKSSVWLALLLVACGGGGGEAPTTPTTPTTPTDPAPGSEQSWLSFSFDKPELALMQGDTVSFLLKGRSDREIKEPLRVRVEYSSEFELRQQHDTYYSSEFEVSLGVSRKILPGKHHGMLTVSLCRDDPKVCASPYPGSPWKLRYDIEVLSSVGVLGPLVALDNSPEWNTQRGNNRRSGYMPTSSTLDASKFSLRWRYPGQFPYTVISSGGRAYIPGTLKALDEIDGSLLWQGPIAASVSVVSDGKVFSNIELDRSSYQTMKSFDAKTGAVLKDYGLRGFGIYNDRFIVDESSIYRLSADRIDIKSGEKKWEIINAFPALPTLRGDHLYVPSGTELGVLNTVDGTQVMSIPGRAPDYRETISENFSISENSDRVITSSRVYGDFYNIDAFSLGKRQRIWAIPTRMMSVPSVADGEMFTVSGSFYIFDAKVRDGRIALESRSTATGELLWSIDLQDAPFSAEHGVANFSYETVIVGDWVFISSDRHEGYTFAVNRKTRKLGWRYPVAGKISASKSGILYIGRKADDYIYAINLH